MLKLNLPNSNPRFKSPMANLVTMPNTGTVCAYHRMSQIGFFIDEIRVVPNVPISSTQTLAEYFKVYRSYHQLLDQRPSESTSRIRVSSRGEQYVQVRNAAFVFRRTLRVPDDANEYLLPPVSNLVL
jgi:hypothetical protein